MVTRLWNRVAASRVGRWFGRRVWPALRPALVTAAMTFIGLFAATLTGWLADLSDWLAGDGIDFPDPSVLAKAAVSAAGAALAGLVNWAVRQVQVVTGRGAVPTYRKG